MTKISPYRDLTAEVSPNIAWLVVYTRPNCEFVVNYDLFERGFETYLPLTETNTTGEIRKVPYLPRYLFVKCCEKQYLLKSIPEIATIVSFGDDFATISDNVIAELRSRECDSYPKYIPNTELIEDRLDFLPNALVRVICGPHIGSIARFERNANKHRAIIVTEGKQSYKLNIPLASIIAQNNYSQSICSSSRADL